MPSPFCAIGRVATLQNSKKSPLRGWHTALHRLAEILSAESDGAVNDGGVAASVAVAELCNCAFDRREHPNGWPRRDRGVSPWASPTERARSSPGR